LQPKIWVLAKNANDLKQVISGRNIAECDPLLIGEFPMNKEYVVLLGAWGKDIEYLDEYFGKKKVTRN